MRHRHPLLRSSMALLAAWSLIVSSTPVQIAGAQSDPTAAAQKVDAGGGEGVAGCWERPLSVGGDVRGAVGVDPVGARRGGGEARLEAAAGQPLQRPGSHTRLTAVAG